MELACYCGDRPSVLTQGLYAMPSRRCQFMTSLLRWSNSRWTQHFGRSKPVAMMQAKPLQGVAQIGDEMEPITHLEGVRRAVANSFGKDPATITTDNLNRGMGP